MPLEGARDGTPSNHRGLYIFHVRMSTPNDCLRLKSWLVVWAMTSMYQFRLVPGVEFPKVYLI